MSLKQNLNLTTGQNLVMTPAMQQAIKVLEFNHQEILEYLEQQLLENPLLAATRGEPDEYDAPADEQGLLQTQADDSPEDSGGEMGGDGSSLSMTQEMASGNFGEAADKVDMDFSNNFDSGYADLAGARPDGAYDEEQTPWEERRSREKGLYEELTEQVTQNFLEPGDRVIATRLIDALDDSGWMVEDVAVIADQLGVSEAEVLRVLEGMQHFEPAGIFARTLAECLRLQLGAQGELSEPMAILLDNLPLLAEGKFNKLKRLCHCDDEELGALVGQIRRLDPKPAAAYDLLPNRTITPDVFVTRGEDGEWVVELNNENLPNLLVDRHYYARAVEGATKTIEKEYLTAQYQNAMWLRKALNQRATTILKVAAAVVNHQHQFLEYGVSALQPLVLQQIADTVDMHPSTISRATNDKYISTPRGIFELKYLFQAAIESSNPNVRFSAESIRHRIKDLIGEEDPNHPVSDDALSEILHAEGIKLARRTIAKYREEMSIPSSSKRKRRHLSLI